MLCCLATQTSTRDGVDHHAGITPLRTYASSWEVLHVARILLLNPPPGTYSMHKLCNSGGGSFTKLLYSR